MVVSKFVRPIFVLLNVLHCGCIYAQSDSTKAEFAPAVNFYGGHLVKNYSGLPDSKFSFFCSFQATWQLNGSDIWHQYYNFPQVGCELFYSDFGNKNELGHNIAVIPILQIKSKKRIKTYFKFGMGIAYFNKPFNAINNPNNLYLGSHFANMSLAAVSWQFPLKKNAFIFGLNAAHCSDGHVALPNAGMNFLMLHLGYKFNAVNSRHTNVLKDISNVYKRNLYTIKISYGSHEFGETTKAVGGPSYPTFHFAFNNNIRFHKSQVLQTGFVLSYYTSFYDYIINQQFYSSNERIKASTAVLTFGHEFVMGKVSFSTIMGIYVYNKFYIDHKKSIGNWSGISEKIEGYNTNRLGIIYYPFKKPNTLNNTKKQLGIGVFIKANLGQADMFEYSISYTF